MLEACGLPTDRFDTMVYIESGRAYYRSDAFLRIVRHLPMCWPLLAVAGICPRFIRDRVYDLIARNRYRWFGRRETCLVPSGELKARFLCD